MLDYSLLYGFHAVGKIWFSHYGCILLFLFHSLYIVPFIHISARLFLPYAWSSFNVIYICVCLSRFLMCTNLNIKYISITNIFFFWEHKCAFCGYTIVWTVHCNRKFKFSIWNLSLRGHGVNRNTVWKSQMVKA